jgi:(p)ppGpp synthase/HD superfamily hydrolase
MERFNKIYVALRYYLLGKNFHLALHALAFAKQYHTGVRKDKVSPELQHQIEIAQFITTLKDLKDEHVTLVVALLHDVMEDYDISHAEMESKFGKEITNIVWLLTKKYKGSKKDPKDYFEQLANDPIASIVKGADRIHNVQTMIGVFNIEKQKSYIEEVETYFIPMIKKAKYNFPEQTAAYFNIEHMLKTQVALIKAMHKKS